MRSLPLLALLAGCIEPMFAEAVPDEFDVDAQSGLCLVADATSIVLDGESASDQRVATTVTFRNPDQCVEPQSEVTDIALDDPAGAFRVEAPEVPLTLTPPETFTVAVTLVAEQPGVYEGQLQLLAFGAFGEGTLDVQLYGEVPEPE